MPRVRDRISVRVGLRFTVRVRERLMVIARVWVSDLYRVTVTIRVGLDLGIV